VQGERLGAMTDLLAQARWIGIGSDRTLWDRRVASLDSDAELLRDRSPLHRRSTIMAALLMVHGADDSLTWQNEVRDRLAVLYAAH